MLFCKSSVHWVSCNWVLQFLKPRKPHRCLPAIEQRNSFFKYIFCGPGCVCCTFQVLFFSEGIFVVDLARMSAESLMHVVSSNFIRVTIGLRRLVWILQMCRFILFAYKCLLAVLVDLHDVASCYMLLWFINKFYSVPPWESDPNLLRLKTALKKLSLRSLWLLRHRSS